LFHSYLNQIFKMLILNNVLFDKFFIIMRKIKINYSQYIHFYQYQFILTIK